METTSTLLTVICLIAATASIAWFVVALPLRIAPSASLHFGVANALFTISIVLTLQRTEAANWWYWSLADLLGLLSVVGMHLGTRALFKLPSLLLAHAIGFGVVMLVYLTARPSPESSLRFGITYSVVAGFVMALIAFDSFRAARKEFTIGAGIAVAWPFATIAVAMLARGMQIASQHNGRIALANQRGSVDDGFTMWLYTFLVLLLNISLFASVLTRLVMKVRNYAERDFLTELLNRRAFDARLALERSRHERNGGSFCLVVLDIDHFKHINDRHGHAVGDLALRHVAALLTQSLRPVDAVARFGGEEFLILLPDTTLETAAAVAERLRQTLVENPLYHHGHLLPVQASFGFVSSHAGDNSALLDLADQAMYRAKTEGRNRVCGVHSVG
ncbi:MAG: diguanylate cyclase [Permianibacter sp.]